MKNAHTRNGLLAALLTAFIVPSIHAQPTITANPPPLVQIYSNSTAYLSVTANDSSPISYQWMVGPTNGSSYTNLANGGDISGATNATLVISNVGPTNVGSYIVTLSDPASVQSTATILTVLPAPTDLYGATVMSNSPLAFWRMNETSGTNLYDYAGGFNGTYAGNIHLDQLGIASTGAGLAGDTNPAVLFDGSTGYAVVPPYAALQAPLVFTVEAWGYLFDPANFPTIISTLGAGVISCRSNIAPVEGWSVVDFSPTAPPAISVDNDTFFGADLETGYIQPPAGIVTNNQWTLYTISCDGTNVYSYLNGALVGEDNLSNLDATYVPALGQAMTIGCQNDPNQRFWFGKLTEAAIYSTALSSNVISNHWVVGITGGLVAPVIAQQPLPAALYAGQTANFIVQANCAAPISWQWMGAPTGSSAYTNLNTGANIYGATSNTLTISNISAANAGNYVVVVTNSLGSVTSSVAPLTVVAAPTDSYGAAVMAANPVAYWRMSETNGTVMYDYVGGNNGTYQGNVSLNQPVSRYDSNAAVLFDGSTAYAKVTYSNLLNYGYSPLNSSNFSVECWVNATGGIGGQMAPIANQDTLFGNTEGYNLYDLSGSWSFQIDNNTTGVTNASGPSVTNGWTHLVGTFAGTNEIFYVNGQAVATNAATFSLNQDEPMLIGAGDNDQPTPAYFWTGLINEAAVYSNALTPNQVEQHYLLGSSGVVPLPNYTQQPQSLNLYVGRNATFTAQVASYSALTYQWMGAPPLSSSYTNVINGGNISGATSSQLVISNVTSANAGNYFLVSSNSSGATNSSVVTLTVVAAPTDAYGAAVMSANPVAYWRMNETSGTTMYDYAGGYNGVYNGSVTLGRPGISTNDTNLAVAFDGSTAYSQVPYAAALNSSPFTVEYWVKPTNSAGGTPFVNQDTVVDNGGNDGYFFTLSGSSSWQLQIFNTTVGPEGIDSGTSPAGVGSWTDVALTFDGTNAILYLNGANVQSSAFETNYPYTPNPAGPLYIGAGNNNQTAANFWPGDITEAAVYNTALSPVQLQTHYALAALGGDVPPVITNQPPAILNRYATLSGSVSVGVASSTLSLSYQWQVQSNSTGLFVNLTNGSVVSGVNTNTLVFSDIPLSYSNNSYLCVVSNAAGATNSSVTTLIIPPVPTDAYGATVFADGPSAWWRMNETTGTNFYDNVGGNNGAWGISNTINTGVGISGNTANNSVLLPGGSANLANMGTAPYNYAVESVPNISIEVWFKSTTYSGATLQYWMVVQNRVTATNAQYPVASSVQGPAIYFGDNATPAVTAMDTQWGVGPTYENSTESVSNHIPTFNTWSHAVATYNGTNEQLYFNGYLVASAILSDVVSGVTNIYNPVTTSRTPMSFGGVFSAAGNNALAAGEAKGYECEAAVYPYALSISQITNHYYQATGTVLVGPSITNEPASITNLLDAKTSFTVGTSLSSLPETYQWQVESNGVYINLATNAPGISGVTTATLVISNAMPANATNYEVVVSYPGFPPLTSNPALLTVIQPAPINLNYTYTAGVLTLTWTNSDTNSGSGFVLLQATNVLGPWTTNTNVSGVQIDPTNAQMFYQLQAP
jgi:hypothetical protein